MTYHPEPQQQPPRAPSPTPSEKEELERGIVNWKKLFRWQTWFKTKYIPWYIGLIIILTLVVLMTIYHTQIVHWLRPAADWMHSFPVGWLIPIIVLFIISFPPLFGHEIVAVLCGVVWGLWVGFAIVCAGTLIGEIGNFYAFRYCFRGRAIKMEKKNPSYACLARVVRDGGFLVAFVVRLSAIPGHFTTAVFSTCGMNIWVFTLAAFLSLPKQFITVYLGVLLEQSADGQRSTRDTVISDSVLAVTFLITVVAAWWIWREMSRVRLDVFRERRAERKAKLAEAGMELGKFDMRGQSEDTSTDHEHSHLQAMMSTDRLRAASTDHLASTTFNPRDSDDAIAMQSARTGGSAQHWDNRGKAVGEMGGYGGGVYQPKQHEPRVPAMAYDGNGAGRDGPYGGMESYTPYDPYAPPANSPPRSNARSPPRGQQPTSYPPAPQSSLSPPRRGPSPSTQYQERPTVQHYQESTVGTYRTAYDGQ